MDEAARKRVLRLFTYGLYAFTAREGETASAMTANWVTQVSFDPSLLTVSLERSSRTGMMARRTGRFALCVYAEGQRELAGQLGRHSVKAPDKFMGVAWEPGAATGCPILAGTLGAVECRITATMDAGDSVLVIAEVLAAYTFTEATPLTMGAAGWKHAG